MTTRRTAITGYLLRRALTLSVLVAIMGCDADRDAGHVSAGSEEMPGDRVESTATGGEDSASEPDYADRNATSPEQVADRARSTDRAGAAANQARYSQVKSAIARISPTIHGRAEGTVTFSAAEDGESMRVAVEIQGLEPGLHGFHVHETGDCSADDASSAGGHFSPHDASHGSPEAADSHVGDLGNIEADDNGQVATELTVRHLAFSGPSSILQKAVVVHSGKDDLESQPSGDSGDRVGCGVIRVANNRG